MKKNNKLKPNTLLLLFAILTLPMTQSSLGQDAGITLNWKDADIRIVVEAVSEARKTPFTKPSFRYCRCTVTLPSKAAT
jgi:type II secretory pathway component GspD/PulD (secretin)